MKNRSKYQKLTKEFLILKYIKEKKSIREISKESEVTGGCIRQRLIKFNIPRRTISEGKKGKKLSNENIEKIKLTRLNKDWSPLYTKEYLFDLYHNQLLSLSQISQLLKCSVGRVLNKLKLYNISRRSLKDAGKIYGKKREKENNVNWNNGSSFEPYPLGWTKTYKEQIRCRDGHKCQLCGVPEIECIIKLHVHHIDYNKKNISPDNLISLCSSCHSKTVGKKRDYWIRLFRPFSNFIKLLLDKHEQKILTKKEVALVLECSPDNIDLLVEKRSSI
jgi:hypothetical protein